VIVLYDREQLLEGDENALADAVDTLSPALLGYAHSVVLNAADAADAVQTAFVRLWQHRAQIRESSALEAYLYRCVYHACIDIIRRRRFFEEPPRPAPASGGFTERTARALAALPPLSRAILYGRAVEEMSYAELAARFRISEAAARKRYERARRRLADLLTKNPREEQT